MVVLHHYLVHRNDYQFRKAVLIFKTAFFAYFHNFYLIANLINYLKLTDIRYTIHQYNIMYKTTFLENRQVICQIISDLT